MFDPYIQPWWMWAREWLPWIAGAAYINLALLAFWMGRYLLKNKHREWIKK